jgi:hypothetical protein
MIAGSKSGVAWQDFVPGAKPRRVALRGLPLHGCSVEEACLCMHAGGCAGTRSAPSCLLLAINLRTSPTCSVLDTVTFSS